MKKRILSALIAVSLLMSSCTSRPADSSAESASSEEHIGTADTVQRTHIVSGTVTHGGHLMEVKLSVPENWNFDSSRKWVLIADKKDVLNFLTVSIISEDYPKGTDYDWSETDKEYRAYDNFVEDGKFNIPNMTGKYYIRRYENEDQTTKNIATCFIISGSQIITFEYFPASDVPIEELERHLEAIEISEIKQ